MGKLPSSAREVTIFAELPEGAMIANQAADLALGVQLRAYRFDRYKTKTQGRRRNARRPRRSTIAVGDVAGGAQGLREPREAIAEGVIIARDLVNEPANVLYPEEFARRAAEPEEARRRGRGARRQGDEEARHGRAARRRPGLARATAALVVMRWNGGKKGDAPVAFVGKGVCFDTGGISIKPAAGMEDMKGDMAGAACVVGLMHALAARKAKVNAVGVIGLVENMPDGNAQRPGDIVTSMSGQTIEIINTDAEGRLVLADVLWYAAKRFKPKFMVDLATLTGAIIVALGQEYAGLFSNDDELAERLTKAGEATGELVWRMPLGPDYDKMIDSKFADMKNTGGRAGAARSPRRNSCSVSSPTRRRGRISTSPAPPSTRARPTSTRAGARAGACGCSTGWWRIITRSSSWLGATRMTEILFYHLQGQKLEGVLPPLLEKSLERGWRVVVQGASEERIEALDAHLWTYRDDGFLPHGTWREPDAAVQPVLLTVNDGNPNARQCPLPDRRRAGAGRCRGLRSASCWCSTARTRTRSPPRARIGPTPRPRASRRPTGSRTSRAAGSRRPRSSGARSAS